jgi:hypothetical protein
MKKVMALLLVSTLLFTLTACSGDTVEPTAIVFATQPANESGEGSATVDSTRQNVEILSSTPSVEYDSDDLDSDVSEPDMSYIKLEGNSITLDGSGAIVEGNVITITAAGTYSVSGTLNDGQIRVNTEDKETVKLILNGADIACATCAPIYVINADKTVITLADGTENHVTDGTSYIFEDAESDEPNAAIFSQDDLTINGTGSLTVNANYNDGITSKDDLKITGGSITVNAVNDGIKGRDSIAVKDGTVAITAGGDGMQSNYDDQVDSEKGYISIEGGTVNIIAEADGIQAEYSLMISGGNVTISSGGGSINARSHIGDRRGNWDMPNNSVDSDTSDSAKGLKAGIALTITGGTINIDSADDSIHSNDSIVINDGTIALASGDDGVHADSAVEINGGDMNIATSYEGIESAVITINNGNIHIVASDDGINVVSGEDGPAPMGRPPGRDMFNDSGDNYLYVNGGYVAIDSVGDGLDVNGSVNLAGGVVIINGPTSQGNGALDYYGDFKITGGFLAAVGSSGMAEAPGMSSSQYSVLLTFPSPMPAGTMIHLEAESGEDILTLAPTKEYQTVVLSSPELKNGSTYIVYTGGSSTGTIADGLYSEGTYTAGTQYTNFTVSSIVTIEGAYGGGFQGGRRRGP